MYTTKVRKNLKNTQVKKVLSKSSTSPYSKITSILSFTKIPVSVITLSTQIGDFSNFEFKLSDLLLAIEKTNWFFFAISLKQFKNLHVLTLRDSERIYISNKKHGVRTNVSAHVFKLPHFHKFNIAILPTLHSSPRN